MANEQISVYVIDDDDSFRRAITRLLEAAGYVVFAVPTIADLEDLLPFQSRSCLLVDLMLGPKSGLSVVDWMRDHEQSTPVVFVSATDDDTLRQEASTLSGQDCLPKPVELDVLISELNSALDGPIGWH